MFFTLVDETPSLICISKDEIEVPGTEVVHVELLGSRMHPHLSAGVSDCIVSFENGLRYYCTIDDAIFQMYRDGVYNPTGHCRFIMLDKKKMVWSCSSIG